MTNIRETDLPGIGRKFQFITRNNEKLVVIIHDDGRRELYYFDQKNHEESQSVITLDDDEARILAGIVGGMQYKPKALETIDVALENLVIEWYKIEKQFYCIGKSIGQLDVRQQTGASIIAVIEKERTQRINPGPDYILTADSTLIVAGERRHFKALKNLLMNGSE